ncbi:MAG: M20/M25/M40 family metallo-hydrolase [Gemmatimonadota bacterium]|nr:M20/M25/M40 family metallo-hydrolase [Gemmatimonadota bacterium]
MTSALAFATALAATLPAGLAAQAASTMPGYAQSAAAAQRRLEQEVIQGPQGARARAHSAALSKEPHVAGTPAQKRTADYVIAQMKAMGLETELRTYDVYLPHATGVKITRMGRDTAVLDLQEPGIPRDAATMLPQYLPVNGYGAAGVGEGELVFVNFGLIEDYATLDSMGVSVKGKVVLARYGRSFRGIKSREAEKRGAVAVLIYTDPLDDGFVQGDVYPEGPMRPLRGLQRGSVFNGAGDPLTPGYASLPGAPRLKPADTAVPKVPVVPISAANAEALLAQVRGTDIPRNWQGGMSLRYHVGPGPVRVRVEVTTDEATAGTKQIHNTLGYLRGSVYPNEYVYIGSHRDSWGPGAADNISGTVSVLEAAQSLADLAKRGDRPKRTIVFATWDAEEWGLVGSTEYVEDDSLRLKAGAVAYLNQDVSAQGSQFGGGGSPSMRAMLRDVTKQVQDPRGRGTVYDTWRAATGTRADTLEPPMGDPGGGSDFAGFYNHFGIPMADWGFGGPSGIYHSAYDTFDWMERFGDPGFQYHATAARIGAATLLRLANAPVLPYDYAEFARTMTRYVAPVERGLTQKGWNAAAVVPLTAAITRLEAAAVAFATARDAALAAGVAPAAQAAANRALLQVERALARNSGLKSRPWYRSLIYASDVDNGYSTMSFPGINESIRYGTQADTEAEINDLAARFGAAAEAVDAARRALTAPAAR